MNFYNREIDHINLTVPNLENAVDFYTNVLGFKNIGEYLKGSMKFVFVSNGTISYEIIENPSLGNGVLEHMAYSSNDLQKDFDYFKSLNLPVTDINFIAELFDNGMNYFFVQSPTGERIEFCERK